MLQDIQPISLWKLALREIQKEKVSEKQSALISARDDEKPRRTKTKSVLLPSRSFHAREEIEKNTDRDDLERGIRHDVYKEVHSKLSKYFADAATRAKSLSDKEETERLYHELEATLFPPTILSLFELEPDGFDQTKSDQVEAAEEEEGKAEAQRNVPLEYNGKSQGVDKSLNLLVKSKASSLSLLSMVDVTHEVYSKIDTPVTPFDLTADDVHDAILQLIRAKGCEEDISSFLSSFSLLPMSSLTFSSNNMSLMHIACAEGKVSFILKLIEMGFPVNCVTMDHQLPIHYLIENWPTVSSHFPGNTGASEFFSLLLTNINSDFSIPTDHSKDFGGDTLLHYSVRFGCLVLFRILLARGADPYRDANGRGDACTYVISSLADEVGCTFIQEVLDSWTSRETEDRGKELLEFGMVDLLFLIHFFL